MVEMTIYFNGQLGMWSLCCGFLLIGWMRFILNFQQILWKICVPYFRQGIGTVYLTDKPLCISGRVRVWFIKPTNHCVFQAGYGYGLFNRQTIVYFRQGTDTVYLTDKPLRISGRVWVRFTTVQTLRQIFQRWHHTELDGRVRDRRHDLSQGKQLVINRWPQAEPA